MAISKERLEELIKEGATIYDISGKYVGQRVLHKLCWVDDDTLYFDRSDECELAYMNDLFETKEQAEWHLKYHATRVEELNLPMFKEFIKTDKVITFTDKDFNKYDLQSHNETDIMIWSYLEATYIFIEQATEENYEEACNIVLKLFMGENDDK